MSINRCNIKRRILFDLLSGEHAMKPGRIVRILILVSALWMVFTIFKTQGAERGQIGENDVRVHIGSRQWMSAEPEVGTTNEDCFSASSDQKPEARTKGQ
jgi:hypothetical protein